MSIIDDVLNRFGFVSQKQLQHKVSEALKAELDKVPKWLSETADAQQWDMPSMQVFATQADMYRLSPILGTALDVLGDDVGESKFNVKRIVGEEEKDIPNHPFEVNQYGSMLYPNPLESGSEFLRDTVINYKLNGNAIWWLNRSNKNEIPAEIWSIPFQQIEPVPDGKLYLKGYNYYPGNGKNKIMLPVWQIVHFKTYNPSNRFVGLSPIESLALTLQGDYGMRRTSKKTYTDYGGSPRDILAFKEWIPDEAWDDIKKEKTRAAIENSTMMLRGVGDGVSWMARAMSNKDMDFINMLKQNMVDIFNRIAPGLLSVLSENTTEANALAGRATYSEKSLWKTQNMIARKTTSEILPAYGRKLIGSFDDPRFVDRKLKLEEQAVFERSHTLAEVRKEFYQDDPLGDERDDLLPSQITAKASEPEREARPAELEQNDVVESTPATNEPMKADLMRWKRLALRKFGKPQPKFESDYIPPELNRTISTRLKACKSTVEVAELFESIKPVARTNEATVILKAIEAGVKALELKR